MSLRISRWLPLFASFAVLAGPALAVEQGDVAPPFKAVDFAGRPVEFPAVAGGKPAVVVFWATWCGYCKAFMPYLKNIEADYAAQGVKVVAINAKERGAGDPKAYVAGLGFAPIAVARSRIPRRPVPVPARGEIAARPRPSSETSSTQGRKRSVTSRASAWRAAFWSAS